MSTEGVAVLVCVECGCVQARSVGFDWRNARCKFRELPSEGDEPCGGGLILFGRLPPEEQERLRDRAERMADVMRRLERA